MATFLTFGSDKACQILSYVSPSTFHETCEGFGNDDAYYRAGGIFWCLVALSAVLIIMFARGISRALG